MQPNFKRIAINKNYQKGIKATKEDLNSLNLVEHEINNSWNYTIYPFKSK